MAGTYKLTLGPEQNFWVALPPLESAFSWRVGRDPECELPLPRTIEREQRRTVSRFHFRFFSHDSRLWIEDLESHNFTYIDGRIVFHAVPVPLPATIRAGAVQIGVEPYSGEPSAIGRDGRPKEKRAANDSAVASSSSKPSGTLWEVFRGELRWAGALLAVVDLLRHVKTTLDLERGVERELRHALDADEIRLRLQVPRGALEASLLELGLTADDLSKRSTEDTDEGVALRGKTILSQSGRQRVYVVAHGLGDDVEHSVVLARTGAGRDAGPNREAMETFVNAVIPMILPYWVALRELEVRRAAARNLVERQPSPQARDLSESLEFWGVSAMHRECVYLAETVATRYFPAFRGRTQLPVAFIVGEPGTGTSRLARLIHERSSRRDGPIVELNCAAIPVTLVESALFGFERGAYDEADQSKAGLFESAAEGTLFLDEVGKTSREFQSKLIKVLDTRAYCRLGSTTPLTTSCNVVLATSEEPEALCESGAFLREFWYRVGAFTIEVPPLRKRPDDIVHLSKRKLDQLNAAHPELPDKTLTEQVYRLLQAYDWPGNVRELMQSLDVAWALSPPEEIAIDAGALPAALRASFGLRLATTSAEAAIEEVDLDEHVARAEREYLVRMLDACEGNIAEVARRAGKSYPTVHGKLKAIRAWLREAPSSEVQELLDLAGQSRAMLDPHNTVPIRAERSAQ